MTTNRALEGIIVIEWAGFISGPYCGRLLADMGAEVIKVEPPGGDVSRRHGPFAHETPDPETGALHLYVNSNKKSVTLDTRSPTGIGLLKRLIKNADIFIEDTTPGTLASMGLDFNTLYSKKPGLIYASITPFGQTGPYSAYKGHDLNVFGAGGEGYSLPGSLSQELFPGREPVRAGGYLSDYDAGMCASVALMAALLSRNASGLGQHLDISRQEAAIALTRESVQRYIGYGEILDRSRSYYFGGIFQCTDGFIVLFPREDRHWESLCAAMDREDLAADPRFKTFEGRRSHRDEFNSAMQGMVRDKPKQEVYQKISAGGCPAGFYATAEDVASSAQLRTRKFFTTVQHPTVGEFELPLAAYHMSETMPQCNDPPPLLGQHTMEILQNMLGLEAVDLTALRRAGTI
ncbi:CoA transferase [Dehalococcoidia bacterium]|nr:CoA transferase [Dehalococcoidia bacterium]